MVSVVVVIIDVVGNGLHKGLAAGKLLAVVSFTLNDAPKAFHRSVVDAAAYSRHTLRHPSVRKLPMEYSVGILWNPLSEWNSG